MTLPTALTVARKELVEAARDRRSLAAALLYGIWGPLAMALALTALARDRDADRRLVVAVEGLAQAPALASFLTERNAELVETQHAATLVRARDASVALVITTTYGPELEAQRQARLRLLYDTAWSQSRTSADRARRLLDEYGQRIREHRLILRGVSPAAMRPLKVIEQDLSTAASRAAAVLTTLPIFLLVSAFVGGMGVAADQMAGERERGSLESLLIHPGPRRTLVIGKWLAASAIAVATVTLTLVVSQAVLQHPRIQALDLPVGLSRHDFAAMWLVATPLALMVAALQLLIALLAKTYKEAQTHLSFLIFAPMVPGFLFAFGSIESEPWMRWLPVVGHHLLIGDVLRGELPAVGTAVSLTLLTMVLGTAALWATAALLDRESIVRRVA